jgi:hypothetical protein
MTQSLHDRLDQSDLRTVSDEAALAIIRTPDPALPLVYQDASLLELANILRVMPRGAHEDSNEMSAVIRASQDASNPDLQHTAIALVELFTIELGATSLGWGDSPYVVARVNAILDTLQSAGVISATSVALIKATAQRHQSWDEANLGHEATLHEVSMAR